MTNNIRTLTADQKFSNKYSDLNSLTFSGRLGKDPEVKIVGNNNRMAKFSVASTFHSGDEFNGLREETTWLNVVAWGDNAKLVENQLKRGMHVTLYGRLSIRTVKNEGQPTAYYTQLVLESFNTNDKKNTKRNSGAGNGAVAGPHFTQQTIADRHDNTLNAEVGEEVPL